MKIQRLRIAKVISKTKAGVLTLPDIKIYYEVKIIKSVSFGTRIENRQMVKRD